MLNGPELGKALQDAMRRKGTRNVDLARAFKIKPPSVYAWTRHGRIDKKHLDGLISYFADVVGPEHWGITGPMRRDGAEVNESLPVYSLKAHNDPRKASTSDPAWARQTSGQMELHAAVTEWAWRLSDSHCKRIADEIRRAAYGKQAPNVDVAALLERIRDEIFDLSHGHGEKAVQKFGDELAGKLNELVMGGTETATHATAPAKRAGSRRSGA